MRYVRPLAALALLGVTWVLGPATPAGGTGDDVTVVTQIDGTPDNGCPPWARDTITRTTTLRDTEYGVRVSFHDQGTFETSDGRQGTLEGDVTFHKVEGEITATDGAQESLDNSGFACKDDVDQDRRVSQWPLRYVSTDGVPDNLIKTWEWTYTLCGVSFTETDGTDEVGLEKFPAPDADECQPPPPTSTTTVPDTTTTVPAPDLPANCDEAAELPEQYWPHLDGDDDGISCEEDVPTAPPAQPVPQQPNFTG